MAKEEAPAPVTAPATKAPASAKPVATETAPQAPVLSYPHVLVPTTASGSEGMDPVMVFARKLHESLVRNTHLSTP